MTYAITGLDPTQFAPYFLLPDDRLAAQRARRLVAAASAGFPCRVSLRDAEKGEELLLLHHVSHAVETPYRHGFAIYVRRAAGEAAHFVDEVPPVFTGRPLAMRGFDAGGSLCTARLAMPGQADEMIRTMLEDSQIAYIDVHNAAHGCFAARVTRHGEPGA